MEHRSKAALISIALVESKSRSPSGMTKKAARKKARGPRLKHVYSRGGRFGGLEVLLAPSAVVKGLLGMGGRTNETLQRLNG